jgi:hypothetical protein
MMMGGDGGAGGAGVIRVEWDAADPVPSTAAVQTSVQSTFPMPRPKSRVLAY